jgi:hypothetical protein
MFNNHVNMYNIVTFCFTTSTPEDVLPPPPPCGVLDFSTFDQGSPTWKDLPGHRHGKPFIGRPRKRRAEDLLKLRRHQLKTAVAVLTGHAPVRRHLYTMGLCDGDPACRFCGMEAATVQRIICCCEALAPQRYNVFGKLFTEPEDTSTASIRDLCVYISGTGL